MRNRWEDSGARDLDAPATITERELRSLRRRAGASVIAMILALLSTGVVGYAVVAGGEGKFDLHALRELLSSGREPPAVQAASSDSAGVGAGRGMTAPDSTGARSATAAASTPDSAATKAGK
jgi:hypothetical protein